jgi:septum formation protein
MKLILASASPRRRRFLQELKIPHSVASVDLDETPAPGEDAIELAARLALAKAQAVAEQADHSQRPLLVIGSDTVVALVGEKLGKPVDDDEAFQMLRHLRSAPHQVHSALAAVKVEPDGTYQRQVVVNSTDVIMRPYSDEEIMEYVATGDPMDKAGAYAIQHEDFRPVQSLQGCPAGVMGLPLADLRALLAGFGLSIELPLAPICRRLTGFTCCQDSPKTEDQV